MNKFLSITLLQIMLQALIIPSSQAVTPVCNYNTPGYIINRFADNGDGTVFDNYTGLIWQRCIMHKPWNVEAGICGTATGLFIKNDWKTTLSNIALFNDAEFSKGKPNDWRLPNIKELTSIINLNCAYSAIDTSIFPTTQSSLWSSTPAATLVPNSQNNSGAIYVYENYIWTVSLYSGLEIRYPWSSEHAAILVRDEPAN